MRVSSAMWPPRRRAPPHRLNCCEKNPRPWSTSWLECASQLLRFLLHRLRGRVRGAVGVGRSQAQEEGTFADLAGQRRACIFLCGSGRCSRSRGSGRAQWGFQGSGKPKDFSSSQICALVGMVCLTPRRDWPMRIDIGANFWPSSPILCISVETGKAERDG